MPELNSIRDLCHKQSLEAGWWDDLETAQDLRNGHSGAEKYVLTTKIALIHSEISEMMEGLRKGVQDDHLPQRTMEEVELVDTLIRLFDYAGARGFDLDTILQEKLEYNRQRKDHKKEHRDSEQGKKF